MAQKQLVHCRYTKCDKLHESKELNKEDAIKGGQNSYYHPDCYHMMTTINRIRDRFINEINPLVTGPQIGTLVATINNIVFSKGVDVDCLEFLLDYFIKYKPGALHVPQGLHYIIQDRRAMEAWKKEQNRRIQAEMRAKLEEYNNINTNDVGEIGGWQIPTFSNYKANNKSRFSNVLGV